MNLDKIRAAMQETPRNKHCQNCAALQQRVEGLERRLAELNAGRGGFDRPRKVNGRFNRPERKS